MKTGLRLQSIAHYHQPRGQQPRAGPIQRTMQCVELVTGGRGWYREGDDWVEVVAGDLLWHVEGEETIGRSEPDDPYRCLAVRFEAEGSPPARNVPRHTYWPELDEILRFTREAVRIFFDPTFPREVLCTYLYGRLLFQANLSLRQQEQEHYSAPLREVWQCIESDYAQPLTSADLARVAGWSVPHLHERFRQEFNMTPWEAITRRRLHRARELIAGSGLSIKEIAASCGYAHSAAFCNVFRRATGETPSQFRRRQSGLLRKV